MSQPTSSNLFRFWSSFDLAPVAGLALAALADRIKPAQMLSHEPAVLTSGPSLDGAGYRAGFVLGAILRKAEDDDWHDRVKTAFADAPLRLPGMDASQAVFFAGPEDAAALQKWMVARLCEGTLCFAAEAATANLAVGQLRMRLEGYEQMLLDERIAAPAVLLRQTVSASGEYAALDPDGVALTIDPGVKAIYAIDLLLGANGLKSNDQIMAELIGLETGTVVASWTIDGPSRPGWRQFWLPHSPVPGYEICQMRVRANRNSSWSIGLGRMDRQNFFSAGLTPDANPLACRVWQRSMAWDSPPSPLSLVPDGVDAPSRRVGRIWFSASDLMAHAVAVDPDQRDQLQWRDDVLAFQIHPQGRKPVIASLRNIPVTLAERMTAEVVLGHSQSQDTEFALWATPSDLSHEDAWLALRRPNRWKIAGRASEPDGDLVGTGARWIGLAGGERGYLNFRFESPYSGDVDIFMATRNRSKRSDFAWAHFKSLLIQ